MPFYVLCCATVVSFKLILSGPSCVDCKYNFAFDSAGVVLILLCVEGCWDNRILLFNRFFS